MLPPNRLAHIRAKALIGPLEVVSTDFQVLRSVMNLAAFASICDSSGFNEKFSPIMGKRQRTNVESDATNHVTAKRRWLRGFPQRAPKHNIEHTTKYSRITCGRYAPSMSRNLFTNYTPNTRLNGTKEAAVA